MTGRDEPKTSMRIDIVTLFPEMFVGPFDHSMVARAREAGRLDLGIHDLRRWTTDKHAQVDDYPYGGGGGMVLKPEPVFRAVEDLLGLEPIMAESLSEVPCRVLLMTPQGRTFDHALAAELAQEERLLILCGHYEGFDERIRAHLATDEISIGDYVLTGGELPAMVVTDAVVRLRPGVIGQVTGTETDSHAKGLLEHPHYTRPADFRGWQVPEVLMSGHHGEIAAWRRRESLRRTAQRRPKGLDEIDLNDDERRWLGEQGQR